ncbi:MAG TPA: hypothetical protein VE197_18850, partial [Mycobacterium sp.]|nr:hypothetical protein [Mycobacterium sp.]
MIDQLTHAGDGANEDDDVAGVDPDGSAACDVIGEFSGSIERWWSLKGEAASKSPPAMKMQDGHYAPASQAVRCHSAASRDTMVVRARRLGGSYPLPNSPHVVVKRS